MHFLFLARLAKLPLQVVAGVHARDGSMHALPFCNMHGPRMSCDMQQMGLPCWLCLQAAAPAANGTFVRG